jgi:rhodanese-related sulfurtransferase
VVFACDDKVRATLVASWYRQFGFEEVYAVDGGTTAWAAAGLALEQGSSASSTPFGLAEAREQVKALSPQELQAAQSPVVIFVNTSQEFASGHVPGANWVPRGSLELQIGELSPSKDTAITVTCSDGRNAALSGATLREMGYENVSVLEGGMAAWQQAGLPVEKGLSGVMLAPTDMVNAGADRNFADRMMYLRWETALGDKYAS